MNNFQTIGQVFIEVNTEHSFSKVPYGYSVNIDENQDCSSDAIKVINQDLSSLNEMLAEKNNAKEYQNKV